MAGDARAERLAKTASEYSGKSAEELVDSIGDDGLQISLTQAAFEAAMSTADEQKIDALARVWAHGLSDDARIDEDMAMVEALKELQVPHIKALAILADGQVYGSDILSARLEVGPLTTSVMNKLVQLGMIYDEVPGVFAGAKRYQILEWGLMAIAYLEERQE